MGRGHGGERRDIQGRRIGIVYASVMRCILGTAHKPGFGIRKPGEQYCPDCIQEDKEPEKKDKKPYHCWAAEEHNFKSDRRGAGKYKWKNVAKGLH